MQNAKFLRLQILSPAQCRAARALLKLSQADLAEKSQVSRPTIADFEAGLRIPYAPNLAAIVRVFEEGGVRLLQHDEEGGVGARLVGEEKLR